MKLSIWHQVEALHVYALLVGGLDGDAVARGDLERDDLARGRDAGDGFQLLLELSDGP